MSADSTDVTIIITTTSSIMVPQLWHQKENIAAHRVMIRELIMDLLQKITPKMNDIPKILISKLTHIVKRIEKELFYTANSFEEYLNVSTLKFRVHQLSIQMNRSIDTSRHHNRIY